MKPKRILLVSPVFHGYWKAIQSALEGRGYNVAVHCYDLNSTFGQRLGNKLLHELPEKWRPQDVERRMTLRAVSALESVSPDIVVVVKGDQLGHDWWQALADRRLPRVTWIYDGLHRMRFTPERLQVMGPVASFSLHDTKTLSGSGVQARHLPLAYDSTIRVSEMNEDNISFVGARYPSRERLLRGLAAAGIPVKAYGLTWSRQPLDVLRTRQFTKPGIPTGRHLPRERAYGVMRGSPATLNIHDDAQDGFTIRTFEACGVGGLQILDRPDVEPMYEVGREVLVFRSAEELVELCRRILKDRSWADQIRKAGERRTMAEHTFDHRAAVLEGMWG